MPTMSRSICSHLRIDSRRRGAAALLAMIFLTLFTTLTLAMYTMATLNVRSASNLSDVEKARTLAESGLRWQAYRFIHMNRPKTTVGNLSKDLLDETIWPQIKSAIVADYQSLPSPGVGTITVSDNSVSMTGMSIDNDAGTFAIHIEKLSTYDTSPGSSNYRHYLRVTSTGVCRGAVRTISMDFTVDKKVKFAVVGKTRIQLGRNTLVEGPVGMGTAGKFPPLLQLSDFKSLTSSLTSKINSFEKFLENNHSSYDGRIRSSDPEWEKALDAGWVDYNGDNFLDEFDIFLNEFDADGDKAVSEAEFTNPVTRQLYDDNLFKAMDSLGWPQYAGETLRHGLSWQDGKVVTDGKIDSYDAYAKVNGQVMIAATAQAWTNDLSSSGDTIDDMIRGPIAWSDPSTPALQFGAADSQIFDLDPQNFDTTQFRNRTGASAGTSSKTSSAITNATLSVSDSNGGYVDERTPYGSTSYQATYHRPIFRNMTFTNVRIPKGLNARFDNCTFRGVTFVDLATNITTSGGRTSTNPDDGKSWAQRRLSGQPSFSKSTPLTPASTYGSRDGNNLRFDGCTFEGPLASSVPTAYTHFANTWEFTGATRCDNQADETATMVAPQTNVEMGSFTDPGAAPSTLVGVVVTGNIDIRGTSIVDGSVIVTGDGAGNTTLGWFGPSDDNTDASSMPEGGYGRLNIRYNPYRSLPDGINLPVDILPDGSSYLEGTQ
jgi:hypothetical protein